MFVILAPGISDFATSRPQPPSNLSETMSSPKPPQHISCTRCQSKKIRCNRVQPRCDKCEAIGADCRYLPRKSRTKKLSGLPDKDILLNILDRLERLEDHCRLSRDPEDSKDVSCSMTVSSVYSDINRLRSTGANVPHDSQSESPKRQGVVHSMLNGIKDDRVRRVLSSNVFCHLRNVESRLFENETCVKAIEAAMTEVENIEKRRGAGTVIDPPEISKEAAKRWVNLYYDSYQFEGFRVPLEKSFLLSIPDLLEIRHVHLDNTSQIIYYNIIIQGILLDPDYYQGRGKVVQYLYQKCMMLVDDWLGELQNTPADMFATFLMISMTLEGCNSELSIKIFGHACNIARALGFFSVDAPPEEPGSWLEWNGESESEVDKNRKRFEFWHLLRVDCLFRLSFGEPSLIPGGSWKVNFPDPTITGIDNASTRFIQIHFLASMRLTLVLMKYLDLTDGESNQDTDVYDKTMDGLIAEVQLIMSDWNAEELVSTTTNHVDTWFAVDILFSSYKMLIVFSQSKKCNQDSHVLPRHTVDIARKSLKVFRSLMSMALHTYWGISLILLHQFIPFFILCTDAMGPRGHDEVEEDLDLVGWLNDFVEKVAEERPELKPIAAITKALAIACQQIHSPAG